MESRILQLISALRASGVRVSLAESAEAFTAVDRMGIQDRETFRLSLRATLIKDRKDLAVYDRLFPLFFGQGAPPPMGGNPADDLSPAEAEALAQALRQFTDSLRERMERLMSGKPLSQEELESLGRLVGLGRMDDLRYQNWMAQRMMRALAFPEVRQAFKQLMEELERMGMSRDRLEQIQDRVRRNLQGMQAQIEAFAGERLAENLSRRPRESGFDDLSNRPFRTLTDADKQAVQREVRRLAAALRTRIALRQKRAKNGQLDPKATLRANQKYHGVPMEIRRRDRARKPKLVVICDVSTSMRFCSELMLSFLFALQGQVRKTHAFAFIDHLEYISGEFDGADADRAIASVLLRMPSGYYNTDLGWSLKDFQDRFMDTLNGETTLIIVGDGRNNHYDPQIEIFAAMCRRARRSIWLNPEPPSMWRGDSDMPRYAPLCTNVVKVATLRELASAVDSLLIG